ncbi:MAG: hypothetical protein GF307_11060 [candidate division Zixibacteria bacterium]|nr:hypothetical protein [candidate division Zixibacteria bacterium]
MNSISIRFIILLMGGFLAGSACDLDEPKTDYVWNVPYPNDSMAVLIQRSVDVDSMNLIWSDPLDVIFMFVERSPFRGIISPEDVEVIPVSMISFEAVLIFPDDSATLKLKIERAYPRKGARSILRITEAQWADD